MHDGLSIMSPTPADRENVEPFFIDELAISAYFICPRKSFLLLHHRAFNLSLPPAIEYTQVLKKKADNAKHIYLRTLRSVECGEQYAIAGKLEDGATYLLHTSVNVGDLRAQCPLLRKNQQPSTLGRYSYEPGIFVGTASVSKEQTIEVRYLAHVLTQRQGMTPKHGFVVTADAKIHKIKLAPTDKAISTAIEAVRAWHGSNYHEAPSVRLNKHCSLCQFRSECDGKAQELDDLSLLQRMTPKLIRRYQKKGIFTVNQLSYVFRPRRNRKKSRQTTKHFNVEIQALAIRTGQIYIHDMPVLPRSHVEMFLDIEGIPDQNFHYLFGLSVLDQQHVEHHALWADRPEDEGDIWRRVLAITKKYPDAPIYHYGSYEPQAIAELEKRHGVVASAVKRRLVNLNTCVFGNIYFPVRSNTLKQIGRFLGAKWRSEDASGLQSLVWRYKWEQSGDSSYKNQLIEYNEDDCVALRGLANCITRIIDSAQTDLNIQFAHRPKQFSTDVSQPIHKEFEQILKSAHLRYKEHRIKIGAALSDSGDVNVVQRKKARPQSSIGRVRTIRVLPKRKCPNHKGEKLAISKKRIAQAIVIDVAFTESGCRRVVTKFTGPKGYCATNSDYYNPPQISKLGGRKFGSGFQSWVAYARVVLRLPYEVISHVAQDMMGIRASDSTLIDVFRYEAERYASAQILIERRILQSRFVHADETRLSIRGQEQYVWVLTDGEHVTFRLTETREGSVINAILNGYNGVLISDFYPGYDGVPCKQQKCWVHLIRDINNDLWKNPFDREFELFVVEIRKLIVPIIQAVHRYGLKRRHLSKFEREVEQFYVNNIIGRHYHSEPSNKFHKRFERYRDTLFLFLTDDGIPWENNMAERALRQLAVQRKISGSFNADGALHFLRLLGLAQTCRFQNKSFLQFLLSGISDIDEFRMKGRGGFVWPQH